MKNRLMAAAAVVAILAATGAARADSGDIAALKAQSAALKTQNAALEKRLNKLEKQQAAQAKKTQQAQAAHPAGPQADPSSFVGMVTKGPLDVISDEGPLTWHGITLYGAYDVGAGWVSHGMPENGSNYEGKSLVNRNGNHSQFLVAQNNLSQTGLGLKGKEEILPGWSGVFNASTGINPQSGQLANMAATNTINNGLPRSRLFVRRRRRARRPSLQRRTLCRRVLRDFGTLTFGRQRALGTDTMLAYDPAGGAYSFSFIGYNGTMAGGGDTQDTRWDDAMKYRVNYGPVHFGAMYKFVDGQRRLLRSRLAADNGTDRRQLHAGSAAQ